MSDLLTTRIFTDGEKGITATKMNDIIGGSSIQTAFYSAKSTASTADAADTLLLLKAAGSYAQVPVSTFVTSVAGQLPSSDPEIWSVRLRSFNACGNPSFSVDQARAYAGYSNVPNAGRIVDRWFWGRVGTHVINSSTPAGSVFVPGTSYLLNDRVLTLTLGTQQTTLGAGDVGYIFQSLEGIQLRPLLTDVHSVSILIKSSIANLKFSYFINDPTGTHTFTKLCSLGAANTWTLVTIPNIPVFIPAGTWTISPGGLGGTEGLCFGSGTAWIASSDGVWLTSGALAAPGATNFFGSSVGATVSVAFIQHEPGPVCSTLMDKPFTQNYDECLRYYCKSFEYGTPPGLPGSSVGPLFQIGAATSYAIGCASFPKPMAKIPTVVARANDGTLNAGTIFAGGTVTFASMSYDSTKINFVNFSAPQTINDAVQFHYTSDTGW